MTNLSPYILHDRQNSIVGNRNRPQPLNNIHIRGVTIKSKKHQKPVSKPDPKPASKPAAKSKPLAKPAPSAIATPNSATAAQERGRISARELHKYVIGLLGVFMLFTIGYSSALYRVERATKLAHNRTAISNN